MDKKKFLVCIMLKNLFSEQKDLYVRDLYVKYISMKDLYVKYITFLY